MICAQWRPVPQRPIDLADQAAQPGAGLAAASSACQVRLLMMIKKHAGMAWSPILPWKWQFLTASVISRERKIDKCWFNEQSCQRKRRRLLSVAKEKLERTNAPLGIQAGKRSEFLAPTQPHEPLLPSDPTIPSDFLCQLISPPDPGRDYPVGYSSTIYRQPLLS